MKRKTVEETTPNKTAKKTEEGTPKTKETPPQILEINNLKSKTVTELKEICRERGLKVGGNKTELLMRLTMEPPPSPPKGTKKQTGSRKNIETFVQKMKDLGVKDPVNYCLLVGIKKGFISMEGDTPLENPVCTSECIECGEKFEIKIKDCVEQTCYPGTDYEDGAESATFQCPKCEARQYVTGLCQGKPSYDSGKFHNHCTECKGGGKCIGDYREQHCNNCGKHYFAGNSGFPCDCKGKGGKGGKRGKGGDDCIIS